MGMAFKNKSGPVRSARVAPSLWLPSQRLPSPDKLQKLGGAFAVSLNFGCPNQSGGIDRKHDLGNGCFCPPPFSQQRRHCWLKHTMLQHPAFLASTAP